ncbi:MAG: hypothetical protein ACKVWR_09360, partial [Acidimicrobiales bacterium]
MRLDQATVAPVVGRARGWLGRLPGMVLLVGPDQRDGAALARAVIDAWLDIARDADEAAPGPQAAARLAEVLAAAAGGLLPPLCLLGQAGERLVVFVHGPVEAAFETTAGPLRVDGSAPGAWLTRMVEGVCSASVLLPGAAAEPVDPVVDLARGVVRADGVTAAPRPDAETAGPAEASAAATPAGGFVLIDLKAPAPPARPPLPLAGRPDAA